MLLIGVRFFENSGKKTPSAIPRMSAMKIHDVRDSFFRERTCLLTFSPFQLLPENVEKKHFRRPNQLDSFWRRATDNAITSDQRFSHLAINCEKRPIFAVVENLNNARVRYDYWSIGQHVRAD